MVKSLSLFDEPPAVSAGATASARDASASEASAATTSSASHAGSSAEPVLLAVDGNGLAHRAYHGSRSARGPLHTFATSLCAVAEHAGADALVVGFDGPADRCERRARYAPYKAHRPATDPGVHRLLADAADWLAACGVAAVDAGGWEADDVVASAAAAAEAAGWRCRIASSDRDAYAVVSDATTVLDFRRGVRDVEEITPRRLRRKPGVAPGQYVEYAALRGDPSDNLPGVPGIGPRRAAALLSLYACVDDAAADPLGLRSVLGAEPAEALQADLAAGAGSGFRRNVALMTPRRDLPVDVDGCRPARPAEAVAGACETAGLPGVAGRAAVALGAG